MGVYDIYDGGQKIFKTDARGQIRVPVERREALLDEFEKSGMSGAKVREAGGHPLRDICQLDATAQEEASGGMAGE